MKKTAKKTRKSVKVPLPLVHYNGISTMQEGSLHAALKEWYAEPGDTLEVLIDGSVIDIFRDGLLIEIQTRNFSSIKRKIARLIKDRRVRIVHPIAQDKWIVRFTGDGTKQVSRRRSPKRGCLLDIFQEMVRIPKLISNENLTLEILLIQVEEIRHEDGLGSWRRKGVSIKDRRLVNVIERHLFETPADFARLLPEKMPSPFTTQDLSMALKRPRRLAQMMAYCLREMGVIEIAGKQRNAMLYRIATAAAWGDSPK